MYITTIPFNDNILAPSIHYAILSFSCVAAGMPNGLTPQHMKSIIWPPAGDGASALISALTSFVNMLLNREVLAQGLPFVSSVNFLHYERKEAVGLIAVGNTLHTSVAKCVGLVVREEMN